MNDLQAKKGKRLSEELLECQVSIQDLAALVNRVWKILLSCQRELATDAAEKQLRLF